MKRNHRKYILIFEKIKIAKLENLELINGGEQGLKTFLDPKCVETHTNCSTLTDPIGIHSQPCFEN
ncbi:hypothetical protein GCM10022258_23800 [Aquimarina gracilis]